MDEEQLRLQYWEDTRSHPEYPLWVIYRYVGHQAGVQDNQPYLRHSTRDVPEVLKSLETHPLIDTIAQDLHLPSEELRAALWYSIWQIEHKSPPSACVEWNHRIDAAWHNRILTIRDQRSQEPNVT